MSFYKLCLHIYVNKTNLKGTVLWSIVIWPVMGKQSTQAKEVDQLNCIEEHKKNEWEAPFYLIAIIYLFFPTDLDVCFSSPCQNAGTCHNAGAGQFMCLCPAIFRGITCEGNITKTFLQCLWHQRAYIFHFSLVFPLLYVRVRPPPVSDRLPYATTDPRHLRFSSQSSMIKDHLSLATAMLRLCNFLPWFLTSFKRPLDAWYGLFVRLMYFATWNRRRDFSNSLKPHISLLRNGIQ